MEVYIWGGTNTTILKNATVEGNKATTGGGVYVGADKLTIGGATTIVGNTLNDGISDSNIYLSNDKIISLGTGENEPSSTMSAGVTTQTKATVSTPVNILGSNTVDYSSNFSSDEAGYEIRYVDSIVKLMKAGTITNKTPETYKATNHGYITIDRTSAFAGEEIPVGLYQIQDMRLRALSIMMVPTMILQLPRNLLCQAMM